MEWLELIEVSEEKIRLRYYPEQNAAGIFLKTASWAGIKEQRNDI